MLECRHNRDQERIVLSAMDVSVAHEVGRPASRRMPLRRCLCLLGRIRRHGKFEMPNLVCDCPSAEAAEPNKPECLLTPVREPFKRSHSVIAGKESDKSVRCADMHSISAQRKFQSVNG